MPGKLQEGTNKNCPQAKDQLIPREALSESSAVRSMPDSLWRTLRKYLRTDDFRDGFAPGSRAK